MAAPDLVALNARLRELEDAILRSLHDLAHELALAAKAYAERNITDHGFGKTYSTNTYPAFFLHGKELNQKGTKFLEQRGVDTATGKQGKAKKKRRKKGETGDPGYYDVMTNWKGFREAQGLQGEFVDLHYSNKMFMAIAVIETKVEGFIYYAILGANNKEAQDKMNYNKERYGDFMDMALGAEAKEFLTRLAATRVRQVMDNFNF